MICIGHRGASGHAPENTVAALGLAAEMGCREVEVDIRLTRDHRAVLLHDSKIDRTTDGRGKVHRYTLDQLSEWPTRNGECIPSLETILDRFGGDMLLHLELKSRAAAPLVGRLIEERVEREELRWPDIVVSCFSSVPLFRLKKEFPHAAVGLLTRRPGRRSIRRALELGAVSLHGPVRRWTPEAVSAAHEAGLRTLAYTVNDREQFALMHGIGLDGVFTDFPDRFFAWDRERQGG